MRIAFYAPLKAPTHATPSGDRLMASLLMRALQEAGHEVALASTFRSYDGNGDGPRQERLERIGGWSAGRLLRRIAKGAPRPDLWFTYHPYHRAPDWVGPPIARALGIPYVAAEASVAGKQAGGAWDRGHRAVLAALADAALLLTLNPADAEGVLTAAPRERLASLPPFLDTAPLLRAAAERSAARDTLANRHDLDPNQPWLLAVGMMRSRAKLFSYKILGQALARVHDRPWQLIVAGDGPARSDVVTALAPVADRVRWVGLVPPKRMPEILAAADVMVWPAIQEAYGMALLEAQIAGLPVVAGRSGGIPGIVDDGASGRLVPPGDAAAFADALAPLLENPALRQSMATHARRKASHHDLATAARRLKTLLERFEP